jgi:starch phosphorylase
MKEAIRTCAPEFSMRRMVKEYTTRFYVPEIQQTRQVEARHFEKARVLAAWKNKVLQAWPSLELYADGRRDGQLSLGEGINVLAWVKVQKLTPSDLNVELVYGEEQGEQVVTPQKLPMQYVRQEQDGSYRYELRLQPDSSGSIAYGVRVLPTHPELTGKHDLGLIRWV